MTRLAFDRLGAGEPLVLVHGLGSARTTWAPLLPELARRYDVVAVDLPGHGDSPPLPRTEPATPHRLARQVAALLDDLGVVRPHLMGNSLGGWVVLELAADGRAGSVTALAPAGLWARPSMRRNPVVQTNWRVARAAARVSPALLRSSAVRRAAFASASALPGEIPYPVALDAALAQATAPGFLSALDGTLGIHFDRADAVPADVPVTIVWGDRDHVLPAPSHQDRALVPGHSRWVVLGHCGHVPQWDAPGATLRLLDRTTAEGRAATR
ncbi:MAG: alpha/beta fold hydrolase [Actinomycetia bacterium]|nr:alpha/beta fold hydrolase [Actinomycetes bacterium]